MDRAEAALRISETALAKANAALKAVAETLVIKGEKGDPGPKGDKGDTGELGEKGKDGMISAEALADAYQGIWAAGEYERGSIVTFAGSVFISLAKTTDKPETSDSWKLIVKRGRDGKDGKNGAKGEKGDQGPMGRYKGVD